jgi:hypothetical protein
MKARISENERLEMSQNWMTVSVTLDGISVAKWNDRIKAMMLEMITVYNLTDWTEEGSREAFFNAPPFDV